MKNIDIQQLKFLLRPESFCVYRLPPDRAVDFDRLRSVSWYSITRTDEELSIVVPCDFDPGPGECDSGWSCLRIAGKLEFGLVGVISGVSRVLADAGVGIFTVSTYDTDYILVKSTDIKTAVRALSDAGHDVVNG
jgi:uncharacterized protein